jgi:hypothetical protein
VKSIKLNSAASSQYYQTLSTEVTLEEKSISAKSVSPEENAVSEKKVRKVSRDLLVNRLNFVNFQDDYIRFIFLHRDSNQCSHISAFPEPCSGIKLKCRWVETYSVPFLIETHHLTLQR